MNAAVSMMLEQLPPEPVDLVGYSLGGRIALALAHQHPERVARLGLISAHIGLIEPSSRQARLERDRERAEQVRRDPEGFFAQWDAMELFRTHRPTPPPRARTHLEPDAVAEVLVNLSPGSTPRLQAVIERTDLPILCVLGELDIRYRSHYASLTRLRPGLPIHVIPGAGHRVIIDAPSDLAVVLDGWLG